MIQLLLMLVLAVSAVGGTVSAADHAVPGDALYGLDRAMEQVSLKRADGDAERVAVAERLITERLDEAAKLLQTDDDPTETPDPSETPTMTPTWTPTATVDPSATPDPSETPTFTPTATVDPSITPTPTATVDPLLTPTPTSTPDPADYTCTGANPHPRGTDLAEYYQVPYEQIMTWFCQGHFGFGEIMHALEASQQTELTPEQILGMRVGHGWGQIWKELGLKGKPAKDADLPLDPTAVPPSDDPAATDEPFDPGKDNGNKDKDKDKGNPNNPGNGNGQDKDKDKGKPDHPGKFKDKGKPPKPPKVK